MTIKNYNYRTTQPKASSKAYFQFPETERIVKQMKKSLNYCMFARSISSYNSFVYAVLIVAESTV